MMQYDTYQGGLNPLSRNHYTYAHNNPVNLEDPSGNSAIAIASVIFVARVIAKKIAKNIIKHTLTFAGDLIYKASPTKLKSHLETTHNFMKSVYSGGKKIAEHPVTVGVSISISVKKSISTSINIKSEIQKRNVELKSFSASHAYLHYMQNYIAKNEAWLKKKHMDVGLLSETVDTYKRMYADAFKIVMYNSVGQKVNDKEYQNGKKQASSDYQFYINSLDDLINDNSQVINSQPCPKGEEYWVPIYISHGENKVSYK